MAQITRSGGSKDDPGSAVQELFEIRIAVGQDLGACHDSRGCAAVLLRAWIDGIEQICDARPEEGAWWVAMLGWDLVVGQGGCMRLGRGKGREKLSDIASRRDLPKIITPLTNLE